MYIIGKYGLEGYGLYWVMIETMHDQNDGKLTVALIEGFSHRYNIDKDLLYQFYNDAITAELFVTDGVKYWSERVIRNKRDFDEKKRNKSDAGKKGMESRWHKTTGTTAFDNTVITDDNSQITKHNKGKERKGKESIFIKPTLDEVAQYCRERGNSVNPAKWLNHYESNGWMVGRNKMKDWKAAVRTWEHSDIVPKEKAVTAYPDL